MLYPISFYEFKIYQLSYSRRRHQNKQKDVRKGYDIFWWSVDVSSMNGRFENLSGVSCMLMHLLIIFQFLCRKLIFPKLGYRLRMLKFSSPFNFWGAFRSLFLLVWYCRLCWCDRSILPFFFFIFDYIYYSLLVSYVVVSGSVSLLVFLGCSH